MICTTEMLAVRSANDMSNPEPWTTQIVSTRIFIVEQESYTFKWIRKGHSGFSEVACMTQEAWKYPIVFGELYHYDLSWDVRFISDQI
jgi:hypothetical protein